MEFTHTELVKIAEKYLLNTCGCGFALSELSTMAMEVPDAIGFRHEGTILIECKTSRSDFLADRKKFFRRNPWQGVGLFRFYLCQKDLIAPEDLPEKWGLVYVNEKGKATRKVGPVGNIWSANRTFMFEERNTVSETSLMYSALRRLHLQGAMPLIYAYNKDRS